MPLHLGSVAARHRLDYMFGIHQQGMDFGRIRVVKKLTLEREKFHYSEMNFLNFGGSKIHNQSWGYQNTKRYISAHGKMYTCLEFVPVENGSYHISITL